VGSRRGARFVIYKAGWVARLARGRAGGAMGETGEESLRARERSCRAARRLRSHSDGTGSPMRRDCDAREWRTPRVHPGGLAFGRGRCRMALSSSLLPVGLARELELWPLRCFQVAAMLKAGRLSR